MAQGTLKIHGTVRRQGQPVEGAYLDLLAAGDEFIAERRTGPDGAYEFHTTPGDWTVVCRTSGAGPVRLSVSGEAGELAVDVDVPGT